MLKYSFICENFRKFMKKVSKLSPYNAKKTANQYIMARTKTNNLDDAATKYGSSMYDGAIKRVKSIAKKHRRKLRILNHDDSVSPITSIPHKFSSRPDVIIIPPKNSSVFHNNKGWSKSRKFGISNRDIKKNRKEILKNVNPFLNNALIANHEADEYQSINSLSRKFNTDPHTSLYNSLRIMRNKNTTGDHSLGVLKKEQERNHLMALLFGRDKFNIATRPAKEVAINSLPPKRV